MANKLQSSDLESLFIYLCIFYLEFSTDNSTGAFLRLFLT